MESTPPQQPAAPAAGPGPQTAEQQGIATHATDPHERIDGIRAWLAQTDRKLGVRTYAFAAACVLALAAAAVAIVFALQLREDSATTADLEGLAGQLGTVEQEASEAATDEVRSLSERLDSLESDVAALREEQSTTGEELKVVEDDIDELRSQSSGQGSSGGSSSSSGSDSGGVAP